MKRLIVFIACIMLTGCVTAMEEPKIEIKETLREVYFYTETNAAPINSDIAKQIVDTHWSNADGGKLPLDSKLIGLTEAELLELFSNELPLYKVTYEEFLEDVPVEGPKRTLWAYRIYPEDDSGMHIIFEDDGDANMKVIGAYIDSLNGPPTSLEKFQLD
ncbi:hypothetical protein EKG37_07635 [Robertmurraya yapensis]|uniref:DUF4830 domain-containing protein n=1 Tax=Bacillus yapensis TaxID=2492960 RepID=A0A431WEV9_9BACI|nr:hypothetical protein [Bacillus yapensis]RTR34072.1 hypothetical protein EKG37_07635 [Bacillus yapensis]TKS97390.1 hypothetical protein FAR12_07635 [Bacillus yapensis]